MSPAPGERGAVAPLLLGVCALVLLVGLALAEVGALLTARLQAETAADAAALAAAPVTFRPFGARAGPVDEARRFAEANGARLVSCLCPVDRSWAAREVTVVVAREVALLGYGAVIVRATSRARFEPARLLLP